jgi:ATP-dependent exoDNAse (exonuclease V) beta subunit
MPDEAMMMSDERKTVMLPRVGRRIHVCAVAPQLLDARKRLARRAQCARTLAQCKLPVENRLGSGDFDATSNKIKAITMKVSKGLEFPVVALPGVGHMPAPGEDEKEAARVFYVAATRATQRLAITVSGNGCFIEKLSSRLARDNDAA